MVTQVIEETESSTNLANGDLLVFFRPGQDDEIRKAWSTIQSLLAITDDDVLDLIETTRTTADRGKFLKVHANDHNALTYAFLTDSELLDVVDNSRADADRGKVIGIDASDRNVLALFDLPVINDDSILDAVVDPRVDGDRGKVLGISSTDKDVLALFTLPAAYTLTSDDVLDLADNSRANTDRGKLLAVKSDDENALELVDAPSAGFTASRVVNIGTQNLSTLGNLYTNSGVTYRYETGAHNLYYVRHAAIGGDTLGFFTGSDIGGLTAATNNTASSAANSLSFGNLRLGRTSTNRFLYGVANATVSAGIQVIRVS